jgi:hypothetical protein
MRMLSSFFDHLERFAKMASCFCKMDVVGRPATNEDAQLFAIAQI